MHVAFAEDLRVIESSGLVLGGEVQDAFQQKVCVVQDVAFYANAGQEPHCLNVMPVFEQEGAGDLFSFGRLSVGEQGGSGDDLRR